MGQINKYYYQKLKYFYFELNEKLLFVFILLRICAFLEIFLYL